MAGVDRRSGIARLFAASLIGAGAGLLAGGRAIKTYDWRTQWFVPAPLPAVYDAMTSRSAAPVVAFHGVGGRWRKR